MPPGKGVMIMVDVNSGAAPQPGGYAGPTPVEAGHAVPQAETAGIPVPTEEELAAQREEATAQQREEAEKTLADFGLKQDLLNEDADGDDTDDDEGADGGDADGDDGDADKPEDYSDEEVWTHQALKDEIDKRNEGKEDEDHISKGGSSDELRARLVEDDAAKADGGDE